MEGALMEFWVRLTVSEHGHDPESGSALFEAIESLTPGLDPLLDQNLADGRLSVTLSVEAADADDAIERGRPILTAGLAHAGLSMTRLVGIEVSPVLVAEPTAPAA